MIQRNKKGQFLKGLRSSKSGEFKKGQIPWNKGKKMNPETYDKVKTTMFKKGHLPATMKHFGRPYLIIRNDRKEKIWFIHINHKRKRYLKYLCELNGIKLNGNIPRLKEGFNINNEPTINDIIIISRKENMILNSYQKYPEDLRRLYQIKGALNRQINKQL